MTVLRGKPGFTLLETILSLALTAIIIGMLATLSRQWLSSWSLGADRMDQMEAIILAENRLASDIAAALPFSQGPDRQSDFFLVTETELVLISEPRKADATDQLIVVRYQSDPERGVIRSTARYNSKLPLRMQAFTSGIPLLPPQFQISFSYESEDGDVLMAQQSLFLPARIFIKFLSPARNALSDFAISIRSHLPAVCSRVSSIKDCRAQSQGPSAASPLLPQGQTPLKPQKVTP